MLRVFGSLSLIFIVLIPCRIMAVPIEDTVLGSVTIAEDTTAIQKRPGFFKRFFDYFGKANKPDTTKRFDISFIGGPSYSQESSFGIGLVAAGIYKKNPKDTTEFTGQVNLYGKISINGNFKIGFDGTHYFVSRFNQLIYDINVGFANDKFWGIGYDMDINNDNETDYKRMNFKVDLSYLHGFPNNVFIGPFLLIDYLKARHILKPELWDGQLTHTFTDLIGLRLEYDSRDYKYNAAKGLYLSLKQGFAPRFIGNKYAFSLTEIDFRAYIPVWKGGILAGIAHLRWTYGDTPWGQMSKIGGGYTMRGYWEGRYNDKCVSDITLELRQHVWKRNGIVLWAGIGEVYGKPSGIFKGKPLPNYGIGYRWEFKKRVNVRVDYGIGKGESAIVFNINEAF